ncbi:hypothetical protein Pcinc_004317 [Petrolisthes cinctipes]|uniref:Uncharacterized protein n=1 Tax=Petrolisthes cinctipes TaxID=88211 RepID=A0AAE1L1N5_PETCI|nr:hypothetical protein Pcinc_004317 [Petrolisthes cinctipes]
MNVKENVKWEGRCDGVTGEVRSCQCLTPPSSPRAHLNYGLKEAQCDTCHDTHSSASVEATQAQMEVNNTNTNDHQLDHHQQQPDHPTEASIVINRVRQDLRIIYDVGQSTTRNYWSVLCSLMALFKTPLSFPDYIQCFKIAWRSVLLRHQNNHKNIQFMRLCLANDALQCLARQDIKVLGYWESAVQVVLSLVRNSDPNIFHEVFFVNSVLKKWILSVFCDKEMCPNPYILLDMLIMIQTWCQSDDLDNEEVSEHVIAGLMELSVYMDGEYEITPGGTGLTLELSWCWVIYTLLTKGHLTNVYKAATQQIQSLSVGPEARWLARMVEFVAARTTFITSISEMIETHIIPQVTISGSTTGERSQPRNGQDKMVCLQLWIPNARHNTR